MADLRPLIDDDLLGSNRKSEAAVMDRELNSLLSLLDDPDIRVATAVTERLRSRGNGVLYPLLDFIDLSPDELARSRAELIVREFNEETLTTEFTKLARRLDNSERNTLEDGVFLIARYGYPRLAVESYRAELSKLAGMLGDAIAGIHSPLDILIATNDFFFQRQKFRGNQSQFHEPDNSFINRVLDRRMGIPISLSVIYLLIARVRLGLPFSGASAPGHFLIRYDGAGDEPLFVDAFNGGVVLRKRDIKRFLDSYGLLYNEAFLEPADSRSILLRMIRNLIIVFTQLGDLPAQKAFERFEEILSPNSTEDDVLARGM
jgi:regulator of sirC expression with transglutaminase-like and TPR domain